MNILFFSLGKNLKEGLATLEEDLVKLTDELQLEAQCIPNLTHPLVPIGGEDSSTVRKMVCNFFSCLLLFHKGNDA
jgi:seryl-tRNA synthetase